MYWCIVRDSATTPFFAGFDIRDGKHVVTWSADTMVVFRQQTLIDLDEALADCKAQGFATARQCKVTIGG